MFSCVCQKSFAFLFFPLSSLLFFPMKIVGLVSGGKDSCYNLVRCVAMGHELVAIANLAPKDTQQGQQRASERNTM
jgi:hypothetical protein